MPSPKPPSAATHSGVGRDGSGLGDIGVMSWAGLCCQGWLWCHRDQVFVQPQLLGLGCVSLAQHPSG